MNIFAVNDDPRMAALELPDKLIPKMIVESAQMLSTAHRVLDGDAGADAKGLYQKAYENHPSTIWVRQDALNYWWLWMHALTLCAEYKWRFTDEEEYITGIAVHKTETVISALQELPSNIPANKDTNYEVLTDLPLCMPDQYKQTGTGGYHQLYTTESYQKFVTQDKPYMQDVFKAYTRAIQKKEHFKDHHSNSSAIDYPPQWVSRNATPEQKKHMDLHKLMNPETAV
tara:strand:- start:625 stop:1308 length:684 start_codon:yes stop_codon:yes gene_type:complete